jgi:endonuclease/exonuclease/phosphatase family metal-dependent hydrolase
VRSQGELRWQFTGFYRHLVAYRRHESWALLDKLHSLTDLPWLLMGDFNEIVSSDERLGELVGSQRNMYEFGEVLNKCGLVDLGYCDYPFTWENCRDAEANVQKRLDRAVASVAWMSLFTLCTMDHLPTSYSDHVPIFLHMDLGSSSSRPKRRPHKFEEKWSIHPEC